MAVGVLRKGAKNRLPKEPADEPPSQRALERAEALDLWRMAATASRHEHVESKFAVGCVLMLRHTDDEERLGVRRDLCRINDAGHRSYYRGLTVLATVHTIVD